MKTLQLNLRRQWFDMILSGVKLEEYREIKPYWCAYLLLYFGERKSLKWWEKFFKDSVESDMNPVVQIEHHILLGNITFVPYDLISFPNGMATDREKFTVKFECVEIRIGNPDWGAEQGVEYFVLKIGKLVSSNIKDQKIKGFIVDNNSDKDFIAAKTGKEAFDLYVETYSFDEDEGFFEGVQVSEMTDKQLDNPFTMEEEEFTFRMIIQPCVEAEILGTNYE